MSMTRRQMILRSGAATLGLALAGYIPAWADTSRKKRVLFFSKSSDFEHDVIKRKNGQLSYAERILAAEGPAHGIDFTFSKDGSLFTPEYLDSFDAFCFYTSGDLLSAGKIGADGKPHDGNPPMTPEGKAAFLDAIFRGKGFIGIHSAADTFHTGETFQTNTHQVRSWRYRNLGPKADPYTRMLGAEFVVHGFEQQSTVRIVDHQFPGFENLGADFARKDEWYSFTDFSHDLHVLLVQETDAMPVPTGLIAPDPAVLPRPRNDPYDGHAPYQRPPYPSTWARKHGQGRVFYTSLGHGDNGIQGGNTWVQPFFRQILFGGMSWALRNIDADITPNIAEVTPFAWALPPPSAPVSGFPEAEKAKPASPSPTP